MFGEHLVSIDDKIYQSNELGKDDVNILKKGRELGGGLGVNETLRHLRVYYRRRCSTNAQGGRF